MLFNIRSFSDIATLLHPVRSLWMLTLVGATTFGAPADERGIYFVKKEYSAEAIPEFKFAKDLLPVPVLDSRPEWIRLYWKCWELAFLRLRAPDSGSPFVSNYVDEAFNNNIFQWDTIFMVMFWRYGHAAFPAVHSLDNFYCRQHADGFICREIWETGPKAGQDHHKKTSPQAINPPLFSWAEIEYYKVSGDKSRFRQVLPVLEKYVEWLENGRHKAGTVHHLYWSNGLGSGMDNTPRSGSGWTDMSAQMVMQYNDLAFMCEELGETARAQAYRTRARRIAALINQWMWSEDDGLYYDVDDSGEHVKWKTVGCFWPMLAGITSPEQEARLIENLKDPESFWRKNVFPSLAADQKFYHETGWYWRGGVWAPTNYAIIRGLSRQGYHDFARLAASRYLEAIHKIYEKTGTVWELYAPDLEEPGSGWRGPGGKDPARPDFVGWTGCGPIAMLIENIIGIDCDGAKNSVVWTLSRTDRHGIKNLRVADATVSMICDERNAAESPARLTMMSDRPIDVEVHHPRKSVTIHLVPGRTVSLTLGD